MGFGDMRAEMNMGLGAKTVSTPKIQKHARHRDGRKIHQVQQRRNHGIYAPITPV